MPLSPEVRLCPTPGNCSPFENSELEAEICDCASVLPKRAQRLEPVLAWRKGKQAWKTKLYPVSLHTEDGQGALAFLHAELELGYGLLWSSEKVTQNFITAVERAEKLIETIFKLPSSLPRHHDQRRIDAPCDQMLTGDSVFLPSLLAAICRTLDIAWPSDWLATGAPDDLNNPQTLKTVDGLVSKARCALRHGYRTMLVPQGQVIPLEVPLGLEWVELPLALNEVCISFLNLLCAKTPFSSTGLVKGLFMVNSFLMTTKHYKKVIQHPLVVQALGQTENNLARYLAHSIRGRAYLHLGQDASDLDAAMKLHAKINKSEVDKCDTHIYKKIRLRIEYLDWAQEVIRLLDEGYLSLEPQWRSVHRVINEVSTQFNKNLEQVFPDPELIFAQMAIFNSMARMWEYRGRFNNNTKDLQEALALALKMKEYWELSFKISVEHQVDISIAFAALRQRNLLVDIQFDLWLRGKLIVNYDVTYGLDALAQQLLGPEEHFETLNQDPYALTSRLKVCLMQQAPLDASLELALHNLLSKPFESNPAHVVDGCACLLLEADQVKSVEDPDGRYSTNIPQELCKQALERLQSRQEGQIAGEGILDLLQERSRYRVAKTLGLNYSPLGEASRFSSPLREWWADLVAVPEKIALRCPY